MAEFNAMNLEWICNTNEFTFFPQLNKCIVWICIMQRWFQRWMCIQIFSRMKQCSFATWILSTKNLHCHYDTCQCLQMQQLILNHLNSCYHVTHPRPNENNKRGTQKNTYNNSTVLHILYAYFTSYKLRFLCGTFRCECFVCVQRTFFTTNIYWLFLLFD